jgi:hypothetical protein
MRVLRQATTVDAPAGAHPGTISYDPGINTAAVLLTGMGTCPPSGPRT